MSDLTANVTVDDFDPLVSYSNYNDWTTPDPSVNPTFFNATPDVTGSFWHEATYHRTTTPGARAYFNFTSIYLAIYGASTNFTLTIDPSVAQPFTQTITNLNNTQGRNLLYESSALSYSPHAVVIENHGETTLDLFVTSADIGAPGATATNATIDDRSTDVTFNGSWTQQTGPNFYNQTSTYTQGAGNGFEFTFQGSAFYLYGDQVNDHGYYTLSLNSTPIATYNDRSGCGSNAYAKQCEKLQGLKGFVAGLGAGTHRLGMVNGGPTDGNRTFFDFDRLIVTTPSSYPNRAIQANSCPFATCDTAQTPSGASSGSSSGTATISGGTSASATRSATATSSSSAAEHSAGGMVSLWMIMGAWLLKKVISEPL